MNQVQVATPSHIAIRCAYIRVGASKSFMTAHLLTSITEQSLTDDELMTLGERRVTDSVADLAAQFAVINPVVRVGEVAIKNPAYNWPAAGDDNE